MSNTPVQNEKVNRDERRGSAIRRILSGKKTLADFDAADIKKLVVLMALLLVDGDEGEV